MRRRTVAPRHSRTLCAAAGTVPAPFLKGRESVTLISHAHACKTSEGPEANRKQTACAVAPSPSHTLAYCARQPAQPPSPFLDGPKSAPSSARATTWVQASVCDWIPKVGILPAPSRRRPLTLSHTVRASRHSPHHRFSMVQNLSHRTPLSTYVPSVGVAGYRRSANCPRRRAIALSWTPPVRAVRVA